MCLSLMLKIGVEVDADSCDADLDTLCPGSDIVHSWLFNLEKHLVLGY